MGVGVARLSSLLLSPDVDERGFGGGVDVGGCGGEGIVIGAEGFGCCDADGWILVGEGCDEQGADGAGLPLREEIDGSYL